MRGESRYYRMAAAVVAAVILAIGLGAGENPTGSATKGLPGISKPSKDVTVSFVRPGRVVEMAVREGDDVKADQLLARQDDEVELASLAFDKADADDTTEIDVDKKERDEDQIEYEKIANTNGTSEFERRQAKEKVVVDEARIEFAKVKQQKAQIKLTGTQAELKRLKINSPIDGVVAKTFLEVGETADGQAMKAMRIVQVDPLWVELPVPVTQARRLKKGDSAQVTFSDPDIKPQNGKVEKIAVVGDSASQTIVVTVEVPNPTKLQPGESVKVNFVGGDAPVAVKP